MHILSQVKLFLTFFSVTGRGRISILFLRTGQPVHQTIGAIVATLYTTHSYLSLSSTKQDPHHVNAKSKVRTIECTGTQYSNKFSASVVFKLAWRHERHVVSVGMYYKTNFNTSCKFKMLFKTPNLYVKLSLSGPLVSTIVAGPIELTPSQS